MDHVVNDRRRERRAPRVVEIIGPAGAGKTSLCDILSGYSERIRMGWLPDVRKPQDLLFLSRYALQLLPHLVVLYRKGSRWLTHQEMAWLAMLMAWPERLQRETIRDDRIVILDQGPVYLLAEKRIFGPDWLRGLGSRKIWKKVYRRWAATLNLLVWLDTDNRCLMERINTRDKDHCVKNEPAERVFEFLNMYRTAYEDVFRLLKADSEWLRIIRFDTSKERPEEIAGKLLTEFNVRDARSVKGNGKDTRSPLVGRSSLS